MHMWSWQKKRTLSSDALVSPMSSPFALKDSLTVSALQLLSLMSLSWVHVISKCLDGVGRPQLHDSCSGSDAFTSKASVLVI